MNVADEVISALLEDDLDVLLLPLPPRVPSVLAMEAVAFAVRDMLERQLAATVFPARRVAS